MCITSNYVCPKGDPNSGTGADKQAETWNKDHQQAMYNLKASTSKFGVWHNDWSQVTRALGPVAKRKKRTHLNWKPQETLQTPWLACWWPDPIRSCKRLEVDDPTQAERQSGKVSDRQVSRKQYALYCQNGPLMQGIGSWVPAVPLVEEKKAGNQSSENFSEKFHREITTVTEWQLGKPKLFSTQQTLSKHPLRRPISFW